MIHPKARVVTAVKYYLAIASHSAVPTFTQQQRTANMRLFPVLAFLSVSLAAKLDTTAPLDGRYVVILKESKLLPSRLFRRAQNVASLETQFGIQGVDKVFQLGEHTVFSAKIDYESAARILNDPLVHIVEPDAKIKGAAVMKQSNPVNWGLARSSHRNHSNSTSYLYDSSAGEGTCAYILDSGIRLREDEFEDRAVKFGNFVEGEPEEDLYGHGSHVAGIFGSKTYGAAKQAKIFMVKVLNKNNEGTKSSILDAMSYVLKTLEAQRKNCPKGIIVNMSLGEQVDPKRPDDTGDNGVSQGNAFSWATQKIIDAGLPVFVAAGNDNLDARRFAPANLPDACTIGNTDENDNIFRGFTSTDPWGASNFGSGVDLFAPGTHILSTYNKNTGEGANEDYTTSMTGTSMSTPLVAGIAAVLLSATTETFTPVGLCNRLIEIGTKGAIKNLNDDFLVMNGPYSPDVILYNGNGA